MGFVPAFFDKIYENTKNRIYSGTKSHRSERGLDPDVIIETIKQAIIAAYKRDAKEQGVEVDAFDYDAVIRSCKW